MSAIQFIGLVLILIYPILALTVHYAGDGLFACIFILSLIYIYFERQYLKSIFNHIPWWAFGICFIHPAIIIIQSILGHHWYSAGFDAPARLMLAPFVLLFVASLKSEHLKYFYITSALGCLCTLLLAGSQFDGERVQVVLLGGSYSLLSPTRLGYFILNFGIFSMALWTGDCLKKTLAVLGVASSLLISYLTLTRGAWLSIIGIILFLIIYFNKDSLQKMILKMGLIFLAGFALFSFNAATHERIALAYKEFKTPTNLQSEDASSVGHRKQLYAVTALMIMQHPLLGVGRDNFQDSYNKTIQNNSRFDYEKFGPEPHTHPHNESLYAWSELGFFGLVGLIFLYLGPGWFFWKNRLSKNPDIRMASVIGMVMVIHYVISGLPDIVIIFNVLKTSLYSISIIVPMAIILSIKNNEKSKV
jgi:O-antigen ligase